MKIWICCLFVFFFASQCAGQVLSSKQDSFRFYADAMFFLNQAEFRIEAEQAFNRLLKELVISNEDTIKFSFLPNFVKCESSDKQFCIISWQVERAPKDYHYGAVLFRPESKPIYLNDIDRNISRINYETFNSNNWYGALYYHVIPLKINNAYTILGYRFGKDGSKYRIIEILEIINDDLLIGAPKFKHLNEKGDEEWYYRHVINYSPSANVAIKYDETSQIIYFDHVETFTDVKSGDVVRAPDGTFEALEFKNEYWNYIPYQKGEILQTPPREKPVFNNEGKDIFGKKKK